MSAFFTPQFTPAFIQAETATAPTVLRNWRTRGHLDYIGTHTETGWLYNASDVVKIAIALTLQSKGVGMDMAESMYAAIMSEIDVLVELHDVKTKIPTSRFTMLLPREDTGEFLCRKADTPEGLISGLPFTRFLDAKAIADDLQKSLVAALPRPKSNDLDRILSERFKRFGPMEFDARGRVVLPK